MKPEVKPPRSYVSPHRDEQARSTRTAVLRAAHVLFVEQGYGRTTMAAIASKAGVSVETVYATFRNKANLLRRVWDVTIGGDDAEVMFHERPEVKEILAEPDLRRRLLQQARFFAATAGRFVPFVVAVQGASASEPEAAALLDEIGRQRLVGMAHMARAAAATGQLAVTEAECRDVLWSYTDGTMWNRLVRDRGWTEERFGRWLGRTWVAVLVDADPALRERRPARAGGNASQRSVGRESRTSD